MATEKMVKMFAHIIFDRHGMQRLTKRNPALARGEKSIQIALEVPASLFKEPDIKATIRLEGPPGYPDLSTVCADLSTTLKALPGVFVEVVEITNRLEKTGEDEPH